MDEIKWGNGECNFIIKSPHFFAEGRLRPWRSGRGVRCDKSRPVALTRIGGSGRLQNRCEMKSILQMDPRMRELVMLSALAALGCGLAAVQGGLLFVAILA